jgi:hypothetical protein
MRCSGFLKPKAMRWRTRILVFVDSISALESPCSSAASMPDLFLRILRASSTNARSLERDAHASHGVSSSIASSPLSRMIARSCSLSRYALKRRAFTLAIQASFACWCSLRSSGFFQSE